MSNGDVLTGAVEGPIDEVVLRQVVDCVSRQVEVVYVTEGKPNLLRRLAGFNQAARHTPWIVVIDLNGAECAPAHVAECLPSPEEHMVFRVAVRAIEAWLLADRERFASFFGVAPARVPLDPDAENDPKETVVNIARHSRRRAIRDDVVPTQGGGRRVGPGYAARVIEFVLSQDGGWRPQVAARQSDSLARCLRALQ
jgi:hypothetical protein